MEYIVYTFTSFWTWCENTTLPILNIPFSAFFIGLITIRFVITAFNLIIGKDHKDEKGE